MTDLSEPPLTESEVERRLPSLRLIEDDDLRDDTRHLSRYAPAYFWLRPGSTAGYHNAHKHGLWAHTLKLSTVIERLADSYVERNLIRAEDIDRAHAAAILHDQRKAGESGNNTRDDHDLLMADRVRDCLDDEIVARCVAEHMGAWYDGPDPQSHVAELVHVADMIASDDNMTIKIPAPVPEALLGWGYEGAEL
jgi:uncharacterized domain HDIG